MNQSDIQTPKTYWNWRLAWTPNSVYNKFINLDVVWPTYSSWWQRKKPTSFYLEKRKWYKNIADDNIQANINWSWYIILDYARLNHSSFWMWDFEYLIWRNASGATTLFRREYWDCWDWYVIGLSTSCTWAFQGFITTDFACGIPKNPNSVTPTTRNVKWVQMNAGTAIIEWSLYPWDASNLFRTTWSNCIAEWDYAFVYSSSESCGLVRQVLSIENKTVWTLWAQDTLNMSSSWTWILSWNVYADTGSATTSFFPQRWPVLMLVDWDEISIIHSNYNWYTWVTPSGNPHITQLCDYTTNIKWGNNCVTNIAEYMQKINISFQHWYNMVWGAGLDKMYFSLDWYNQVGVDKKTAVSFRNFLVFFWWDNIYTLVQQPTWYNQWYQVHDTLWIFSRNAYTIHDNSLYFLASDRRLYAMSIVWKDWWYTANLEDMSSIVKWDLDMIKDWDDVYLNLDTTNLTITINSKKLDDDTEYNKTKKIIYRKDYWMRTEHHIDAYVTVKKGRYFLGKWLFSYGWNKDWWDILSASDKTVYYSAIVDAFVWEQENNWMDISAYARKKLNWAKVILWRGIYTDDNFIVEVDQYSQWYKRKYSVSNIESIERVRENNDLISGTTDEIVPNICVTDDIQDYNTMSRECSAVNKIQDTITDCDWIVRVKRQDDYVTCVNDDGYASSELYTLRIPLNETTIESDLFRVRIYSKWWDNLVFGWMVIELEQQPIEQWDPDDRDILINDWCCSVDYCE